MSSKHRKRIDRAEEALAPQCAGLKFSQVIGFSKRAPLTAAEWVTLALLYEEAVKLQKKTLGPVVDVDRDTTEEEALALIESGCPVNECGAVELLEGEDALEFGRLLSKFFQAHRRTMAEDFLREYGRHMTAEERDDIRARASII